MMVPSQFLSVVLEEDDGNASDEDRNAYNHRPVWQNQYSVHSNNTITESEMWNLTKNLPKALLAECTVEISRTPATQSEKIRKPCFDAKVTPVFTRPEPPPLVPVRINPAIQQFLPPPPQLLHRSEWLEERMDIQDLLSGVEAVYSDHESDGETEEAASVSIFPISVAKVEKTKPDRVKKQDINKFSYPCEHCPNVYSNRGALWQHSVATHSVEKTCECKICGRKFYRNCSLALHLKSHSEEEYCQCKECGKSFNRLANLERHMRVHAEAKTYPCPHCDKIFRDETNLLRHTVTHSMPRQFQCDICNKGFKSQESLDVHQQSSHANHDPTLALEKHLCKVCGAGFPDKNSYKAHMATHTQTGERLSCTLCGIDFTQKSSLLRHVKRMHQGEGCDPSLLDEKASSVDSSESGSVQEDEDMENESKTVEIRKVLGSPVKSAQPINIHETPRTAKVQSLEISLVSVTNNNIPNSKPNGVCNGREELTITMEEVENGVQNDETDSQVENEEQNEASDVDTDCNEESSQNVDTKSSKMETNDPLSSVDINTMHTSALKLES
ncbi:zinc finger and BTB domain-containing protein 24-like [Macrosteles quadrilineatus]|uniref:zinc finger and BTB domain-containing protein 24-like n=1 Tax=Macrosteles quadrilineatus TaxID=74068 RepID=UPI0023E2AFBF|nr:zinc finger and BTB domain-containing protein 24-like [Macrosteles quadrilineatus]